jgi:septum formation protein
MYRTPTSPLVLASTSRYRRELLDRLGLAYVAVAHEADERAPELQGMAPDALAARLARDKAESIAARHPEAFILGSDQVVDLDGEALGKPGSVEAAVAQLHRLAGRAHRLVTAVALRHPGGWTDEASDVHLMTMRDLDEPALRRVVERDQPLDCAGAYRIEASGIALFDRVEGADFTAIMGLPMLTVVRLLVKAGFELP